MLQKITKRKFLTTTTTAAAFALVWEPVLSIASAPTRPVPRRLKLDGAWWLSQAGKEDWIPAMVPGGAYTDLFAAGKIADPFYRDNEKLVQWVGDSDWVYKRTFVVLDEVLQNDQVLLRCEGLDTLAKIRINGLEAGGADNMFRLWEFDVKSLLKAGENAIEVLFESPATYMKQRDTDQAPDKWIKGRAWVRKEPCSYGWDWGPVLPSCGIWKSISLETFNQARLTDVLVRQSHSVGSVTLGVEVNVEFVRGMSNPLKARVIVLGNRKSVVETTIQISNGQGRAELKIRKPKLWWPAGLGEQPLYTVHVELLDADGETIDSTSERIGLRELRAILPQGESPLHFEVNGIPFFAKGANWIPADSFSTRVTPEISRRFVADAAAVNMNVLRFWGGGYYEDDALFDACDEMGICVWLDFKFACGAYPAFDEKFMENVKLEARDNLQRLRHHPSIAVWCGNNEISLSWWEGPTWGPNRMSTADYNKLFKDLLGTQVQKYAPDANYVSGSPDCGDTHYWEVWHGPKNFDAYRTQSGFMSEFGYQSFPELKTVQSFTKESDRASAVTPVMSWHQRSGGVEGNQKIVSMMLNYFKPPRDFETMLWLSQIVQGIGIKLGAESWRQSMPKSMGCVFWQYNDCWPGMSWSSVDYFGRWKALHYLARKFYAPILVSGLENVQDGKIDVFVTSDKLEDQKGTLIWRVTNLAGDSLLKESAAIDIPARHSQKVTTLALQEQVKKHGLNGFLSWLQLEVEGKIVSDNLVLMAPPKEFKLLNPQLTSSVEAAANGFLVTVKSEHPALWVWLGLENADANFSDNFVHISPAAPHKFLVRPKQSLARDQFMQELRVRSLFDTYS
jgi:beta-mannosidase